MDISRYTRKDIGNLGEKVAAEYLRRHGFIIRAQNVARKTGELDIVVEREECLHIVEVKTIACESFPNSTNRESYNPADNLHLNKIRKVVRTAEWYVLDSGWEGEWQVDGALVWLRKFDGLARVSYFPQIA